MRNLTTVFLVFVAISLFYACDHVPDNVIGRKEMTALLVDIHKEEALIEARYDIYGNDNVKRALRNQVLSRHGVDKARFDTSLLWYGKHIELYSKMYDDVISTLQEQNEQTKDVMETDKTPILTRSGDSVNIWQFTPSLALSSKYATGFYPFTIPWDNNFLIKDKFLMRAYFRNVAPIDDEYPTIMLGIKHQNNKNTTAYKNVSGDGWVELDITADSLSQISSVYGNITSPMTRPWRTVFVDSISIIRIHPKR